MTLENDNPGAAATATGEEIDVSLTRKQQDTMRQFSQQEVRWWMEGNRWRKLPYVRGVWSSGIDDTWPWKKAEFVADRDYCAIAILPPQGVWQRSNHGKLTGFLYGGANWTYSPDKKSPRSNAALCLDLLQRSYSWGPTRHIIEEEPQQ